MRHNPNARVITVKKEELIAKILENKKKHQEEYLEALQNFRKDVEQALKGRLERLESGDYKKMSFNMEAPVDNSGEYDKLVEMFKWEIKSEVDLSQGEFNEYIFDETAGAVYAKSINSTYLSMERGGTRR